MSKKMLILDLDGTLYYQLGVQFVMGSYLLIYYIFHFWRFKDLLVLLDYRKFREENSNNSVQQQFDIIAKKHKLSPDNVKSLVQKWLIVKPLKILPIFKDRRLCKIIEMFHNLGGKIVIYSDYPTKDKLEAMNIYYDQEYNPNNPKIKFLKPNPKGLNFIINSNKIDTSEILYIGDRDSKDGECARSCEVDYIILPKIFRNRYYKQINHIIFND